MPRLSRAIQKSKEGEPSGATEQSHQPSGREVIPPATPGETTGLGKRFQAFIGRSAAETVPQADTLNLQQLLENQVRAEELELERVYGVIGTTTPELTPLQVANTLILLHQPQPTARAASAVEERDDDEEQDEEGDDAGVVVRPSAAAPAPVREAPQMVSWEGAQGRGVARPMMVDGALYEKLTGISNQGRSVLSRQLREGIVGKLKHKSYSPADVAAISARLRRPQVYRNERTVKREGDKWSVDWTHNHPLEIIDRNKTLLAKNNALEWFKWNWLRYANPKNIKEWRTPRPQLDADWRAGKAAAEQYVEAVRGGKRTNEVLAQVMLKLMSFGGNEDLKVREAEAALSPTTSANRSQGIEKTANPPRQEIIAPPRDNQERNDVARQQPAMFPSREEFVAFYTSKDISQGVSPVLDVRMSFTSRRNRDLTYYVAVNPAYVRSLFRAIPQLTYDPASGAIAVRKEDGSVRPFTEAEANQVHALAKEHEINYKQLENK